MQSPDFAVFRVLLSETHQKAFGTPLSKLNFSKAQMLSWLIYEATGELLSYKSLCNYFDAILAEQPEKINPNVSTLLILAEFATGQHRDNKPDLVLWTQFRKLLMAAA